MAEVYQGAKQLHELLRRSTEKCMEKLDGPELRLRYLVLRNTDPRRNITETTGAILGNMLKLEWITKEEYDKYIMRLIEEDEKTFEVLSKLETKTDPAYDTELTKKYGIPERR